MKKSKSTRKITNNQVYNIDQSGRIEYTSHNTVIAICNGTSYSVLLKMKEKRLLHKMYRTLFHKNRQYVYEVFSALIYLALVGAKPKGTVVIDKEYPGKEGLIKLHVLDYDQKKAMAAENITFGLVGKQSSAHYLASDVFKKIKQPSRIVTAQEVMEVIFPLKKTGYSSISGTEGS